MSRKYKFCWSEELNLKLIELWEENEVLYNKKSPEYKNVLLKSAILTSIATCLGNDLTEKDIIAQMKSLRERLSKELRWYDSETRSGAGSAPHKRWPFHDRMQFLKDHINARSPHVVSNVQQRMSSSDADEQVFEDSSGSSGSSTSPSVRLMYLDNSVATDVADEFALGVTMEQESIQTSLAKDSSIPDLNSSFGARDPKPGSSHMGFSSTPLVTMQGKTTQRKKRRSEHSESLQDEQLQNLVDEVGNMKRLVSSPDICCSFGMEVSKLLKEIPQRSQLEAKIAVFQALKAFKE